jgi:hypothetical protein
MSEYCSYGDFCKGENGLKNDIKSRYSIVCDKCNNQINPSYNKDVSSTYSYCRCGCASNLYYSCKCGNTLIKSFECTAVTQKDKNLNYNLNK